MLRQSKGLKISRRRFGIELECLKPYRLDDIDIVRAVGFDLLIESDGSLRCEDSNYTPRELVTPILKGNEGLKYIERLCNFTKERQFRVNKTCGYHVHLSIGTIAKDLQKLKAIFLFYWIFEDVFFSFLPPARADNKYCLQLGRTYPDLPDKLDAIKTIAQLENYWYKVSYHTEANRRKKGKYDSSRYSWVNFHSLFAHTKNLEVRSHNGTLDKDKVLMWILLHDFIVSQVANGRINEYTLREFLKHHAKCTLPLEMLTDAMYKFTSMPSDIQFWYDGRQSRYTGKLTKLNPNFNPFPIRESNTDVPNPLFRDRYTGILSYNVDEDL